MSQSTEQREEDSDAPADQDEGLPEMNEDDFADADLDALADEVEAEAGAVDAGDEPDTTSTAEREDEQGHTGDERALATSGKESWGDMYVGTLTTVSNAIIDEHGTDGAERIDEDLARQLHLDAHFDEFMASRGKSDMPPEQALLIGTTMFLVVVVGAKTDIPSQIMEEADL